MLLHVWVKSVSSLGLSSRWAWCCRHEIYRRDETPKPRSGTSWRRGYKHRLLMQRAFELDTATFRSQLLVQYLLYWHLKVWCLSFQLLGQRVTESNLNVLTKPSTPTTTSVVLVHCAVPATASSLHSNEGRLTGYLCYRSLLSF